eukprot:1158846-Pelagomonas_calceolata.AAC.4
MHRDKNLREEFGKIAEDNGMEAAPETVQVAMGRHLDVALSAGQAMLFPLFVLMKDADAWCEGGQSKGV